MKKIFLLSAFVVSALAVILSVYISSDGKQPESTKSETVQYSDSREVMYVMKTHNNAVGVFRPTEDTPLYTLKDVHVKSLPEYDQNLLNTGIKVYSERELQALIEDYDS